MDDEKITEFMAEYKNRMSVSEKRVKDLEEQNKQMQELIISVHDLANSVQAMVLEQKEQGERLKSLEDAPGKQWTSAKKTFFTSIVSAIGTATAIAFIMAVATYIK